jgi:hypothetical protein
VLNAEDLMRRNLAIVSCLAAVSVLSAKAQANLLVYDGFDYSTGIGALNGQAGGSVWDPAGTWTSSADIVAPIGSIGGIAATGNAAQGEDYTAFGSRSFDPSLDLDAGANYATGGPGVPYYFSFLVNFSSTSVIDSPIQVGLTTPGNPIFVAFGAGTGSTVNMSIAADPNAATDTVALQTGKTYLITGEFSATFSAPYDGLGQLSLSAYSDGSSIPTAAPSSWQLSYTDTDPGGYPSYNNLQLTGFGSHYGDSTGDMTLDEFRLGTEFSDVAAGVPEPASFGLTCLAAGMLLRRRRVSSETA